MECFLKAPLEKEEKRWKRWIAGSWFQADFLRGL